VIGKAKTETLPRINTDKRGSGKQGRAANGRENARIQIFTAKDAKIAKKKGDAKKHSAVSIQQSAKTKGAAHRSALKFQISVDPCKSVVSKTEQQSHRRGRRRHTV
jgi:hypothetical protein